MEEVRNTAVTYYNKLPEAQKEKVSKYFRSMDRNGDGKIAISEFLDSLQIKESLRSSHRTLFQCLDTDGNGSLDFTEFVTFYYLQLTGVISCDGCGVILNGNTYFTCLHCYGGRGSTFELCRSCFSSNNFTHTHGNGAAPAFRETSSLLQMRKENLAREVAIVNNANTNSNAALKSAKVVLAASNTAVEVLSHASEIADVIGYIASSGCTIM